MKHAIMVTGHGKTGNVFQRTIDLLDSHEIDFYVHWDAKYKHPKFHSQKSKIIFVKKPVKVFWGTDTQIQAEYLLMDAVAKADQEYDYVHLISAVDIPLMDKKHFLSFFEKQGGGHAYVDYFNVTQWDYARIRYYYPFSHINLRGSLWGSIYKRAVPPINKLFGVNRTKNRTIYKGTNWFSIDGRYLTDILNFKDKKMFMHSYLGDELLIQTILYDKIKDIHEASLRYIDWKRGTPYTFKATDSDELSKIVNTTYLFARKVNDPMLVDKLYH